MLKNILTVAAIVLVSPTFVFADDIFFAFGTGADASPTLTTTSDVGTGSVFVYSDGEFAFDAAELDFTSSNSNAIQFTGGEAFNPNVQTPTGVVIGTRFQNEEAVSLELDATNPATEGDLILINITERGVDPLLATFDQGFDEEVGVNGAFLLARLDFSVVGTGTAVLDLSLGERGVVFLDDSTDPLETVILTPDFGSATITVGPPVGIPEPSALAMLMLGSLGLVARRRR